VISFLILVVLLNGAFYIISSFDSELIRNNCIESVEIMQSEDKLSNKGFFSLVDNIEDAIVINEAYSIDKDEPIKSYLLTRKNYDKDLTKIELGDESGQLKTYSNNTIIDGNAVPDENYDTIKELKNFLNGEVNISQSYTRYYHGYLVLFRPLLLVFNVRQIRLFMVIVYLILVCVVAKFLYKKIDLKTCIIITSILLTFGYFGIAQSLQACALFLVIMISLIILLLIIEKINIENFLLFLFILGAVVNFVDYFTSPAISLLLPLVIICVYNNKNNNKLQFKGKNVKEDFLIIVKAGLIWSTGYILMWMSKMLLAKAFINSKEFSSAFDQVLFRMFGSIDLSLDRVYSVLYYGITVCLVAYVFTWIVLKVTKRCCFNKIDKKIIISNCNCIFSSIIPIAWMFLFFNHTMNHFILYPYRNLMGIIMVYLLLKTSEKENI